MKFVVVLFMLMFVVSGASAQQVAQPLGLPSGSAVVADFKGEVTVHSPDGSTPAVQRGQTLAANTTIETGKGSILLTLGEGSQVLIKSLTRVQLQAPGESKGNFLQLFLGNIMAKVQKRLGMEPSFRMGTPTAVITVRGTRFSVEVTKKNKTIVEVYEGLVEVVGFAAPNRPVMIGPGFGTQVDRDGAPEYPRSMGIGGADGGEAERTGPRGQQQGSGYESQRPESVAPAGSERQNGTKPD